MGINQVNPIGRESIKPLNLIWPRRLWQRKKSGGFKEIFHHGRSADHLLEKKRVIKALLIAGFHHQHHTGPVRPVLSGFIKWFLATFAHRPWGCYSAENNSLLLVFGRFLAGSELSVRPVVWLQASNCRLAAAKYCLIFSLWLRDANSPDRGQQDDRVLLLIEMGIR